MRRNRRIFAVAPALLAFVCALRPAARVDAQAQAPGTAAVATRPALTATTWPADDAGLTALAARLVDDWLGRTTVPELEAVTQPGFQLVTYKGAFDRAGGLALLAAMGAGSPKVSDLVATRAGDALVVTCLVQTTQSVDGKALPSDPAARIGVWQQADGVWKLAAWASLNMPATRPAPAGPSFIGDATLSSEGAALLTRLLGAQHRKELDAFDAMLSDGMQVINFKGQKARKDIMQGAKAATTDQPRIADARATRCGPLTVVSCTLTMGQKVGFTKLPADPAPFLAVFRVEGDGAKVIAMANTNKPG